MTLRNSTFVPKKVIGRKPVIKKAHRKYKTNNNISINGLINISIKNESIKNESIKNESTKNESIKNESIKNESIKNLIHKK